MEGSSSLLGEGKAQVIGNPIATPRIRLLVTAPGGSFKIESKKLELTCWSKFAVSQEKTLQCMHV